MRRGGSANGADSLGRRALVLVPVVLVVVAIAGPLLAPHDPESIDPSKVLAGPEAGHVMGFDSAGRDMLTRVLYGFRVSLGLALASVAIAFVVGCTIGLIAGYRGGWVDTALTRPMDIMLAFPAFLLAVILIAIVGPGAWAVVAAIALIYMPIFVRVMRSPTLTVSSAGYVNAARCRGVSGLRNMLSHVAPNAIGSALVQASILAGIAIQIEAALSYLGFGAQPPTPSLGIMLADASSFLQQAPMGVVFPGLAIGLSVLGFLIVGDVLSAKLDAQGFAR